MRSKEEEDADEVVENRRITGLGVDSGDGGWKGEGRGLGRGG